MAKKHYFSAGNMRTDLRNNLWFLLLGLLTLLLFLVNLGVGSVMLPWAEVLKALFHSAHADSTALVIVNEYRLPQAITALSVGVLLSMSGLVLQTLFRNPLAGPSVLGISSGASLGVAVVLLSGSAFGVDMSATPVVGNLAVILAALAGALAVLFLILFVSGRFSNVVTVLIIGIMLGYAVSAVVSVLQFFSGSEDLHAYVLWGLGSFSKVSVQQSLLLLFTALGGVLILFLYVKPLNALLLGEQYARSIGFRPLRIQRVLILVTGILVAVGTAFTGPIAFLGLAVPHLARGFFKTSQQGVLLPAAILTGASLALLCNLVAKLPGYDISLPINAVTSLIGAPVIVWVIVKSRHIKNE
jgi:iron complex transport system permease protein